MHKTTFLRWLGASTLTAFATMGPLQVLAQAQPASYPDKPIRIIVPYTPGGFNDTMARVYARKLQDAWGQPVTVENKAGAGTVIGTDAGAKAAPDGYTLVVNGFPLVVNQYLYAKLPYDTKKDLQPVILGGVTPNLLLVRGDSPIKSVADLVAKAKATPGKVSYAAAGNGTSLHLAMEYFASVAGVDLNLIHYKGSAPMVNDLLGGQVEVMFDNLPNAIQHVKSGKMRALGVTTAQRLPQHPDIPTIAEQGYPGFEVAVWYGVYAPAGVPKPIINKLNAELNKAMKADDVKTIFAQQGVDMLGGSPEDFQKYNQAQDAKWGTVIKKAGIKAE